MILPLRRQREGWSEKDVVGGAGLDHRLHPRSPAASESDLSAQKSGVVT